MYLPEQDVEINHTQYELTPTLHFLIPVKHSALQKNIQY